MNEHEIRQLVKIVEQSNIGELEIKRWGKKIRISKYASGTNVASNPAPAAPAAVPAPPAAAQVQQPEAAPAPEPAKHSGTEIKSPMVGTFYRSPSPDVDPYVQANDVVKKGQVLCIIEAMKLMNEIEAEQDGRIVEVLIENAQPVEYNQPLFIIEPA